MNDSPDYDPTARALALREAVLKSMSRDELLEYARNSRLEAQPKPERISK